MNKKELIKRLISCIYKRDGHDVVSVAKLKRLINVIEGKEQQRYSKVETKSTKTN